MSPHPTLPIDRAATLDARGAHAEAARVFAEAATATASGQARSGSGAHEYTAYGGPLDGVRVVLDRRPESVVLGEGPSAAVYRTEAYPFVTARGVVYVLVLAHGERPSRTRVLRDHRAAVEGARPREGRFAVVS